VAVEDLPQQAHDAAVDDVGYHQPVAGLEEGQEQGRESRHAGGEADGRRTALHRPEVAFQRGDRGVAGAAVGVAAVNAHGVLDVRGRLVDRREQRTGGEIGTETAVDQPGVLTGVLRDTADRGGRRDAGSKGVGGARRESGIGSRGGEGGIRGAGRGVGMVIPIPGKVWIGHDGSPESRGNSNEGVREKTTALERWSQVRSSDSMNLAVRLRPGTRPHEGRSCPWTFASR